MGGGGRSAGKIFATMMLYFVIPFYLICNMTMFGKIYFDRLSLRSGGGSKGKIIATMLLYFVIPFNLICNMTMF